MKKLFTLFSIFCFSIAVAFAQDQDLETLQFLNAGNEVVENNAVLTYDDATPDEWDEIKMSTGLKVINNSSKGVFCKIAYTISTMDGGLFEICFPSNCTMQTKPGSYESSAEPAELKAGQTYPTMSAWLPEVDNFGKCEVKMQINIYKKNAVTGKFSLKSNGPVVSCNFIYNDPTGIDQVETSAANLPAYNLMGQPVGAGYKGVVIKGGKKYLSK